MATADGSWVGGDDWKARVEATVNNSYSATQAQVTIKCICVSQYGTTSGYSNIRGAVAYGSLAWNWGSATSISTNSTKTLKTATYTINKTHSAQTIQAQARVEGISGLYSGDYSRANVNVSISAKTSYAVSYNANGGSGAPSGQTKWHGETLTLSSTKPTRANYTFKGWATSASSSTVAYAAGASYTGNAALNLYAVWERAYTAPTAPSSAKATWVSDTRATVSWTNNSAVPRDYTALYVERRTDGGAWSQVASLPASSTSYADTSLSSNHSYEWRVRAYNPAGYSGYAATGAVYTTPAAPTSVSAVRTESNGVAVEVASPTNSGAVREVQRSADQEAWETVYSDAAATFVDMPGGGTFWYRARNSRTFTDGSGTPRTLASAWAYSEAVVTICAPAAPTPRTPASSSVVSTASAAVSFSWNHNPLDGSAQTAAEVAVSTDGGSSWDDVLTAAAAQSLAVPNDWPANATVTWRVRTRGAHADWSPWSSLSSFVVASPPSVSVTSPSSDVGGYPVTVSFAYGDDSGTMASASVTVSCAGASKTFKMQGTSIELGIADMMLENGEDVTVTVSARSTSTLSASASVTVGVDFIPPATPTLEVSTDPGMLSCTVMVNEGIDESGQLPATVGLALLRVTPDGTELLADGLESGATVPDAIPPLDCDFSYRVVASAESGVFSAAEQALRIPSRGYLVVNFGDKVAKVRRNPSRKETTRRDVETFPVVRSVEGGGAEVLPVAFYGPSVEVSQSVQGLVFADAWEGKPDFDPLESEGAWRAVRRHLGNVWVRLPYVSDGRVRRASIGDVSLSYSLDHGYRLFDLSFEMQEVAF